MNGSGRKGYLPNTRPSLDVHAIELELQLVQKPLSRKLDLNGNWHGNIDVTHGKHASNSINSDDVAQISTKEAPLKLHMSSGSLPSVLCGANFNSLKLMHTMWRTLRLSK